MNKLLFICILFGLYPNIFCIDTTIPSHILECYRHNMSEIHNKLKIPMNMHILIELIQKIEASASLDMRLLATSMLYRAKFDGIQRMSISHENENVVPVGPTAIHFNKFRLLFTYLLSGDEELFPKDLLSKEEFCTLHRIISGSVQSWERGDESRTCPQIRMMPHDKSQPRRLILGKQKSICPIETGIIKTNWGDICAGHIIIAIAAALQMQDVKFMNILEALKADEEFENTTGIIQKGLDQQVNNLWASTLAGDLGEVIAYQRMFVENLVFGSGSVGTWNDSLLPQAYFLPDSIDNHWEMTQAETLGGIDGAIIGSFIKNWSQKNGLLRLSQVLDMYYSKRGIHSYKACERKQHIKKILDNTDLIEQTTGMAKLLQHYYNSIGSRDFLPIPEEDIENYCKSAVGEFSQDVDAVTDPHSACEKGYDVPPTDIFVVIDGSWSEYDGRRFVSTLTQQADVSLFGSRMGIMKGDQGIWMTNFTHSVYQIFQDLATNDINWPTSLSLSDSLTTILSFLQNKTDADCTAKIQSNRNSVIVIVSPTSILSSTDLDQSKSLIDTIKTINPNIAMLYVTSPETQSSFEALKNSEFLNDVIVTSQKSIPANVKAVFDKQRPDIVVAVRCTITIVDRRKLGLLCLLPQFICVTIYLSVPDEKLAFLGSATF